MPQLKTRRLVLRPFELADAPVVQALVNERVIADTTLNKPHPYPAGAAEAWIRLQRADRGAHAWAITRDGKLMGSISLNQNHEHNKAELGYWLGILYWGRGYATEAAAGVLEYGFQDLNLNRIYAYCFSSNPASARVLEKAGLRFEGCQRQDVLKNGKYLDVLLYGLLAQEERG